MKELKMKLRQIAKIGLAALALFTMMALACGGSPTPVPVSAPGIVDPTNLGWPRLVSTQRGIVEIKSPPQRVLTPSLGHSEILVSLVEPPRIAGIGKFAYDTDYSNIEQFAATIPAESISRDAEQIISLDPDLVIVSAFAPIEFIEQLETVGMTVVQTQFDEAIGSLADNVRLMAYMLGEVEQGERLIEQVQRRLRFVEETIGTVADEDKPGVIMLGYLSKWTGGTGTSNEDIINRAGGINLPSQEFEGFQEIGDEAVVFMNPAVILLEANEIRDNAALDTFLNSPALTLVDAIENRQVYGVVRSYLFNLSHWRVRGVEEVAKILYPDKFAGVEFSDFAVGPQ